MQTVDIYCRTATKEQGPISALNQQEAVCRVYCNAHGLTIGLVHHEIAPGTTYEGRPAFDIIRARYQNQAISGVVVAHVDRLTRLPDYLYALLAEMEQYQVTLHCANEGLENNLLIRFFRMSQ